MRFSRSFCLLLTEFFLSIRTEISVRSLPLCQILQIFTFNFQRYFRLKYKFCKIFEGTRSLNLHLREPGVLARARAISGPGRARRETISSHLNSKNSCKIVWPVVSSQLYHLCILSGSFFFKKKSLKTYKKNQAFCFIGFAYSCSLALKICIARFIWMTSALCVGKKYLLMAISKHT